MYKLWESVFALKGFFGTFTGLSLPGYTTQPKVNTLKEVYTCT